MPGVGATMPLPQLEIMGDDISIQRARGRGGCRHLDIPQSKKLLCYSTEGVARAGDKRLGHHIGVEMVAPRLGRHGSEGGGCGIVQRKLWLKYPSVKCDYKTHHIWDNLVHAAATATRIEKAPIHCTEDRS